MPSIRQRFHLSPCSDFRSHFSDTTTIETFSRPTARGEESLLNSFIPMERIAFFDRIHHSCYRRAHEATEIIDCAATDP